MTDGTDTFDPATPPKIERAFDVCVDASLHRVALLHSGVGLCSSARRGCPTTSILGAPAQHPARVRYPYAAAGCISAPVRHTSGTPSLRPDPLGVPMANNLDIDITDEFVLVSAKRLRPEFADAPQRVVLATGGFGTSPDTAGTAVFVEYVSDGEQCRYDGFDLDNRLATIEEVEAAIALNPNGASEKVAAAFEAMKAKA